MEQVCHSRRLHGWNAGRDLSGLALSRSLQWSVVAFLHTRVVSVAAFSLRYESYTSPVIQAVHFYGYLDCSRVLFFEG